MLIFSEAFIGSCFLLLSVFFVLFFLFLPGLEMQGEIFALMSKKSVYTLRNVVT